MCEMAKVYDESKRRARKQHKCCECRLPIEVGEVHMRCSGLWDDSWSTFRQHLHCYHFSRLINSTTSEMPSGVECCHSPSFLPEIARSIWGGEMDFIVKFNREASSGRRYDLLHGDECIAFGDVRASLCDIDESLVMQWDAMISGMSEKFLEGAGI